MKYETQTINEHRTAVNRKVVNLAQKKLQPNPRIRVSNLVYLFKNENFTESIKILKTHVGPFCSPDLTTDIYPLFSRKKVITKKSTTFRFQTHQL